MYAVCRGCIRGGGGGCALPAARPVRGPVDGELQRAVCQRGPDVPVRGGALACRRRDRAARVCGGHVCGGDGACGGVRLCAHAASLQRRGSRLVCGRGRLRAADGVPTWAVPGVCGADGVRGVRGGQLRAGPRARAVLELRAWQVPAPGWAARLPLLPGGQQRAVPGGRVCAERRDVLHGRGALLRVPAELRRGDGERAPGGPPVLGQAGRIRGAHVLRVRGGLRGGPRDAGRLAVGHGVCG